MNENEIDNNLEIEKSNLKLKILHHSLFILKKKFEIYKQEINKIYLENKQNEIDNPIITFSIENFPKILNNIFTTIQILIIPFNNYTELITGDLLNNFNIKDNQILIKYISSYLKENYNKYNTIFYEKKMKIIKKIIYNKPEYSNEEINIKFNLYNKRGKLNKNSEQLLQENQKIEEESFLIFENDIDIITSSKYIYSQSIPLILSDYIKNNENLGIISMNDELDDEIKYYFDNDLIPLISKMEENPIEENKSELKHLLFEEINLDQKIQYYENLLKEKKINNEDIKEINEIITKLKYEKASIRQKKNIIKNESLKINKSFLITHRILFDKKKDKRRKIELQKIFYFYTKQHKINNRFATFESYIKNKENMNLIEFCKFCIEFKLKITKNKIIEVFKSSSSNIKEINFEQFLFSLEQIAQIMNNDKIDNAEKMKIIYMNKIKEIKLLMNKEEKRKDESNEENIEDNNNKEENKNNETILKNNNNEEINNEENSHIKLINTENNNNLKKNKSILKKNLIKYQGFYYNKEELENKLESINQELNELYNKSNQDILNELYEYMELEHPNDYKKKMVGFTIPFHNNEKPILIKKYKLKKKDENLDTSNIIIKNYKEFENKENNKKQIEDKNNNINEEKLNNSENKNLEKYNTNILFKTQINIENKKEEENLSNKEIAINKDLNETSSRNISNSTLKKKIYKLKSKSERNKRNNSAIILHKKKESITKPFYNQNDIDLSKLKTRRYGNDTLKLTGNMIVNNLNKNKK